MSARWLGFALAILLSGCVTLSTDTALNCPVTVTSIPNLAEPPGARAAKVAKAAATIPRLSDCRHGQDILAISGGGAMGAYGAALIAETLAVHPAQLAGVCMVTGISTGAVMAPYVFLATSSEPAVAVPWRLELARLYETMNDDTLLHERHIVQWAFAPSIYDVTGIEREINDRATTRLLSAIAREASQHGRSLLVGATDLVSGDFDVIDLGKLAATGRTDCFGKVIQASAAIPIAFPPVPLRLDPNADQENKPDPLRVYVDGGVRNNIFIVELLAKLKREGGVPDRLFGILNYDFAVDAAPQLDLTLVPLTLRNADIILDQAYYNAAHLVDHEAAGMRRCWSAAVGPACEGRKCEAPRKKIFDPAYQACLACFARDKVRQDVAFDDLENILPLQTRLGASAATSCRLK
jgi:hypothetical protein